MRGRVAKSLRAGNENSSKFFLGQTSLERSPRYQSLITWGVDLCGIPPSTERDQRPLEP